jgi:hypothetical protein
LELPAKASDTTLFLSSKGTGLGLRSFCNAPTPLASYWAAGRKIESHVLDCSHCSVAPSRGFEQWD